MHEPGPDRTMIADGRRVDTAVRPSGRTVRWHLPLLALTLVSSCIVLVSYWMPEVGGDPVYERDGVIGNWFNVDEENNLPTWWSTMLLGGAAVTHLSAAWVARRTGGRGAIAWVTVAVLLLAMSLDEATQLHENLDQLSGSFSVPFELSYFWLVFGVPLALGAVLIVLVAGLRLPRRTLALLASGLVLFFLGAVGLEVVGSAVLDAGQAGSPEEVRAYHAEEALEMFGAGVIAVAPLAGLVVRPGAPLEMSLADRRRSGRRVARGR